MLLPNPGKLLSAVSATLTDAVLPELQRGSGYRQLKAAIHLIKRLQRTWDLYHAHVHKDNEDMLGTLHQVFDVLDGSCHGSLLADLRPKLADAGEDQAMEGINDPDLARASQANLALQALVCEIEERLTGLDGSDSEVAECRNLLSNLYRRMVLRDSVYVGDTAVAKQAT